MKVKKISKDEANKIILGREPLGLFYTIEKSEGKNIYVGIDNRSRDAWVEEFESLKACKKWFKE
ncbi:hypothetical protein [Clostridium sp. DL1XJH146]